MHNPTTSLRALVALAAAGALALTASACGSSSSPSQQSTTPTTGASALPTVSGTFGSKPTITFPASAPAKTLQVKTLSTGTGPVVASGEVVTANYLGQIWHGKVFDNSYDRKAAFPFTLGAGQVIKGWDTGLVGKHLGSRLLLVVPPSEGYGSAGSSGAGIKGTDTMTFVIDLVGAYDKSASGDKAAVVQKDSTEPVTVTGALGSAPTVTVAKGAAAPKAPKTVVIAKGSGAPLKAGYAVLQYVAVQYTGALIESTYTAGYPALIPLGASGASSPLDGLIGVPVGSRVLVLTQAKLTSTAKTAVPIAVVVDVVAQP